MFYLSIYLIALGNGGVEPALVTFGADQFDEEDPEEKQAKTTFLIYFYVALNLGSLISETILVYFETIGENFKPSGNPISRFAQVLVASIRKIKLQVPSNRDGLYEDYSRDDTGTRRIYHTSEFKFLYHASNKNPDDSENLTPWRLCTITQVEEVKCVLRLLLIWLSSVVYTQMISLFVEQGAAMNRNISHFQIPSASMIVFDIWNFTIDIYKVAIYVFFAKFNMIEVVMDGGGGLPWW
ncbi:NRT1/ PTR family 7.3-like protein [Tanacetum coccineum]